MQDAFGIRDEGVFKAASGLHGGIGGSGDVCGALLGASLMLGLMCGQGTEEEPFPWGDKKDPTNLVGELYQWFKSEFGSVKCLEIRDKFEKEVAADPAFNELPEPERMARSMAKCDQMAAETAARTAEVLWNVLG